MVLDALGMGRTLDRLEEFWESSGELYTKDNSRSAAPAAVMLESGFRETLFYFVEKSSIDSPPFCVCRHPSLSF